MKGRRVTEIREALGLNRGQFAELMGVHSASVYRWESARGELIVDPFHGRLLALMDSTKAGALPRLGRRVIPALMTRGPLYALHRLLAGLFKPSTLRG